jgi:hypothetical protein
MTAADLITHLQQYPPTTPVVVYASGKPFPVEHVTDACIRKNDNVVVVLSERELFAHEVEAKD